MLAEKNTKHKKRRGTDEIGISGVSDAHNSDSEELTGRRSEGSVGTLVSVDSGLAEHGVVLNLGSSKRGSVLGEEDKLGWKGERKGRVKNMI